MTNEELSHYIIDKAKKKNINDVEVYIEKGESFQVSVRMQEVEEIENSIAKGLGLRLFKDGRTSFVHTSDLSTNTLDEILEIAANNLSVSDPADYNVLPEFNSFKEKELDLCDTKGSNLSTEEKIELAKSLEQRVLNDKNIKNSNGASYSESESSYTIANSNGLLFTDNDTSFGMSVSPVAGSGDKMQTNYWYSYARHFSDLENQEKIAKKAIERTTRILNAQKGQTIEVPVIFENTIASALLGIILSAINGNSVFKNETFLADKLNKSIASEDINMKESPFIKRGLGSSLIDGEGNNSQEKTIIQDGVLSTFLHNNQSAFKMNTSSTGNAVRSYNSTPSIGSTNVILENGNNSIDELISKIDKGLLVTSLLGSGINMITGDFSRGAEGLWIENGKIQYPVNEITIAGNMIDMFKDIEFIGNDRLDSRSVTSPSLLIKKMTLSGK